MRYSAALTGALHKEAVAQLLRSDGQEDLCFGLWRPSSGAIRKSALIQRLILPDPGERLVHGNASFTSRYFERALGEALQEKAGLVFMHSHLGPGWQGMSRDDVAAELGHAAATRAATGLPLVGMTLATDEAWSARFWEKVGPKQYERRWCETVRVVGDRLTMTYNDGLIPPPPAREELLRTISAWGEITQRDLARLRVGVIGVGSVGSLVAEALARMGISVIYILDFDVLKTHNRDRTLHALRRNSGKGVAKVRVIAEALKESATAEPFRVEAFEYSVVEESGFRAALDCDVLFCCVDRPWPRAILNLIANAHLIPVIDGGLRLEAKSNGKGLKRGDWRAHTVAPRRRCLECLGQYDAGHVSLERDGYLDDPTYIAGLPDLHPAKKNENVFAFSMHAAAMETLQFLKLVVPDPGVANLGAQHYHYVTGELEKDGRGCEENCILPGIAATGDHALVSFVGQHHAAEMARAERVEKRSRARERHPLMRFLTLVRNTASLLRRPMVRLFPKLLVDDA